MRFVSTNHCYPYYQKAKASICRTNNHPGCSWFRFLTDILKKDCRRYLTRVLMVDIFVMIAVVSWNLEPFPPSEQDLSPTSQRLVNDWFPHLSGYALKCEEFQLTCHQLSGVLSLIIHGQLYGPCPVFPPGAWHSGCHWPGSAASGSTVLSSWRK